MTVDLADLIAAPPGASGHTGDCCWLQKITKRHGQDVSRQVRDLVAMPKEDWPHAALATALNERGIDTNKQAIYRHRTQVCQCCRVHG